MIFTLPTSSARSTKLALIAALMSAAMAALFPMEARAMPPDPLGASERGVSQAVLATQVAFYDDAAQSINTSLARAITRLELADPDSREAYTAGQQRIHFAQMQAEIERATLRVRGVPRFLDEATRRVVAQAIADGEGQLRELGLKPTERVTALGTRTSFNVVDRGAVEAIARDTVNKVESDMAGDMRGAIDSYGRAAGDLFRRLSHAVMADGSHPLRESSTNRAIARGLITGNPREANGLMREMFRDQDAGTAESYRRLGAKIVQVGAASMEVRSYAALVVRTRTREATIAARHERLGASGISLVQITGRPSSNFCTAFIGLVVSLSGEQAIDGVRYPALASLPEGGPPFHPNCTKGTAAFIRDLVSAPRVVAQERALRTFVDRERQGRLRADVRA